MTMRPRSLVGIWLATITLVALMVGGWYLFTEQSQHPPTKVESAPTPASLNTPAYAAVEEVSILKAEDLFAKLSSPLPEKLDPANIITIAATGDVIPARGVDVKIRQYGAAYPFKGEGIAELLSQADIAVIDLEAPVIEQCPIHLTGFTFCGRPPFDIAMAEAGIDMAAVENNHIGNHGSAGVAETKQRLTAAGIAWGSSTQLGIKEVRGKKIGLLSYNGVGTTFKQHLIAAEVAEARPQVDLLMVAFHWGKEYESVPTIDPAIAPDDPRAIGRLAVDAGADLVLGNHPHWVQGAEMYKDKLILYALGNFIFDQSWSTETTQGAIATMTYYGNRLVGLATTPIVIVDQAQPTIATEPVRSTILQSMHQSTLTLLETPFRQSN